MVEKTQRFSLVLRKKHRSIGGDPQSVKCPSVRIWHHRRRNISRFASWCGEKQMSLTSQERGSGEITQTVFDGQSDDKTSFQAAAPLSTSEERCRVGWAVLDVGEIRLFQSPSRNPICGYAPRRCAHSSTKHNT